MSLSGNSKIVLTGVGLGIILKLVNDSLAKDYLSLLSSYSSKYKIDVALLKAIARKESSFNPQAIGRNTNGTRDYGLMQVNERNFAHYGITSNFLDLDTNIDTASKLLTDIRIELGGKFNIFTWISAYNVGSPHVKQYGITNPTYVGEVYLYYTLYKNI